MADSFSSFCGFCLSSVQLPSFCWLQNWAPTSLPHKEGQVQKSAGLTALCSLCLLPRGVDKAFTKGETGKEKKKRNKTRGFLPQPGRSLSAGGAIVLPGARAAAIALEQVELPRALHGPVNVHGLFLPAAYRRNPEMYSEWLI